MTGRGFDIVDLQFAEKLKLDFRRERANFLDVERAASGVSELVGPFRQSG